MIEKKFKKEKVRFVRYGIIIFSFILYSFTHFYYNHSYNELIFDSIIFVSMVYGIYFSLKYNFDNFEYRVNNNTLNIKNKLYISGKINIHEKTNISKINEITLIDIDFNNKNVTLSENGKIFKLKFNNYQEVILKNIYYKYIYNNKYKRIILFYNNSIINKDKFILPESLFVES